MTIQFNAELAEQVLDAIRLHPERWEQDVWRCDTGMCFAGWTAELTGARWIGPPRCDMPNLVTCDDPAEFPHPRWDLLRDYYSWMDDDPAEWTPAQFGFYDWVTFDTPVVSVERWAETKLSPAGPTLTFIRSDGRRASLFTGDNTLEDLEFGVRVLSGAAEQ